MQWGSRVKELAAIPHGKLVTNRQHVSDQSLTPMLCFVSQPASHWKCGLTSHKDGGIGENVTMGSLFSAASILLVSPQNSFLSRISIF